ncbi:uncharacterized protein LOC121050457 [Rosa chinensis]|uniref:uncharacterized protein LOC121050457 n=1 Tax=Rosa chinensis TaxID=74649 RepID=UPI001AD90E83|nr:uncharacterized protein LOC121050457 [Rosa chinensis]
MSFHGFDPGDRNNWYQSPHLGPFPASPAAYGGGISGRVHNWELPIVDSGCYSFTPEPMAKLKGVEKPQSPPRGSGELQVDKDHTDAKLREMQKSFKSSMDTFMSEFREELRLLRVSSQSPVIQVDNTPKFGSQLDPTIATSLTASGKPLSSTTTTAGGSIQISEPDFNLSPHEAILELNNDVSVVVVSGSSSEDNIDVGMTEKLVLNVDKNIVGSATGVKLSDSHGSDVANSIVWRNDAQTQHTSFRNGSSAGYGELGSHNHNLVGSLRVDFHERDEKELEDEDGEDDNEDEGENDGAESYGDGSLSYSDDSQSVDGQIVTDSNEEVVIDEEGSRLRIKKEALLGDSEFIHDKDHMLEDHKQSIIVTDFPQLLWDEGNVSQVMILNPKLEATLLNRNLVESFATIAVSMLDFSKHASKHKTIDFEQFILYHFGISELMATLEVANLQACLPNWKVRVKFSTSSHKGNFEYDLHITNLIESMRIKFVHMHEKQSGTKSSALHCFGFINSISNIGIQTIVPSTSHAWDFQTHQLGSPLPTSGHFEVINFAKGLLAFQIYFSIGTIGSKMTVIASIGEICNQILQPQMCNSIFAANSTKLSPFVLVILDIELHNQESLSRPLFGANPLLCSLDSDDFRSAVFNFFHHWLCIVLVQAFAKSEGLLNHDLEAPGPHEWLAGAIEIGNPYALILAQKMGEKVYVASARFGKLLPDPFIPSKLFYTDEDIAKTFPCNCEVIIEGSHLPSSHDCKHLPFDALLLLVPRLPGSHIPFCLSSKVVQCITAVIACVVFLTAAYVRYKLRVCCCTEKDLKPAKNGRSGSLFQIYIGKILHVASILVINDELVQINRVANICLEHCIVFLEKKGVKNVHKWGWYKLRIVANAIMGVDYFFQAATLKEFRQEDVGNGIPLVFAPSIQDNEEDGGLIVNDEDVRAGVVLHDDGIMIVEDDITDGDKEPTIPLLWNMFVHLQLPLLVKKATLADETCKIQETMDGSINANSPPIFSGFHDQALIMILYSLQLIRAWHKSRGYLPFEDSNYPTMLWFSYIFLGLGVTLCSGHIAADTANGYGFQMISCKGAQILIQNMKLEDKFV